MSPTFRSAGLVVPFTSLARALISKVAIAYLIISPGNIYIHIHIYICICTYIYPNGTGKGIYLYTHTHIYIRIYTQPPAASAHLSGCCGPPRSGMILSTWRSNHSTGPTCGCTSAAANSPVCARNVACPVCARARASVCAWHVCESAECERMCGSARTRWYSTNHDGCEEERGRRRSNHRSVSASLPERRAGCTQRTARTSRSFWI